MHWWGLFEGVQELTLLLVSGSTSHCAFVAIMSECSWCGGKSEGKSTRAKGGRCVSMPRSAVMSVWCAGMVVMATGGCAAPFYRSLYHMEAFQNLQAVVSHQVSSLSLDDTRSLHHFPHADSFHLALYLCGPICDSQVKGCVKGAMVTCEFSA